MIGNEKYVYLAGLIDGEGCISIVSRKNTNPLGNSRHRIRIHITNTNKELCKWLKSNFGGDVAYFKAKKEGWKDGAVWRVENIHAEKILKKVISYLRIKKKQAKLALKFREETVLKRNPRNKLGYQFLPNSLLKKRQIYSLQMKILNKKGIDNKVTGAGTVIAPV